MLPSSIYGGQVSRLDFFILMQRLVFRNLNVFVLLLIFIGSVVGQNVNNSSPLSKCWTTPRDSFTKLVYASDNANEIYFSTNEDSISAIDLHGNSLWKSEIGGDIISDLLYTERKLYFLSKKENPKKNEIFLYSLSADTGLSKWQNELNLENTETDNLQLTLFGQFIIVLTKNNLLFFDKETGKLIDKYELHTPVLSNLLVNFGRIYLASQNGLNVIDNQTKKTDSIGNFNRPITTILKLGEKEILISNNAGQLSAFDTSLRKEIWSNRTGGSITTADVTDDSVYISSVDNYVYRFSAKSGVIIWRRRFENRTMSSLITKREILVSSLINGQSTVFTDITNGKTLNQVISSPEQFYIAKPLIIDNKVILFLNDSITAYEFEQCADKKE